MLKPVYLVAFSGHRPGPSTPGRSSDELLATAPAIKHTLEKLREQVATVGGDLHLVSSLAAGADVIACHTARQLGIPIHLILPKPAKTFFEQDFPDDLSAWRNSAVRLLASADPHCRMVPEPATGEIVLSSETETDEQIEGADPRSTARELVGHADSDDCYARANAQLLEVADLLLTVWDGEPPSSHAGTGHVVTQAQALKLPHLNVDPRVSQSPDTLPEVPSDVIDLEKDKSLEVFADLGKHLDCPLPAAGPRFEKLAACFEDGAGKSADSFRSSTAIAIVCHATAGFIAAAAAAAYYPLNTTAGDPHHEFAAKVFAVIALIELGFVAWAFFVELKSSWRNDQDTWLHCRFAREIMRGLEQSNPFLDPLFPEIRRHDQQWERFARSCALLRRSETGPLDPGSAAEIEKAKDKYLALRVQHQIKHFDKMQKKAQRPNACFKRLAHWAAPAALLFVGIAFVAKLLIAFHQGGHDLPASLKFIKNPYLTAGAFLFLPIFVPLLASLSASFLASFDFGRRVVRYEKMIKTLGNTENWLPTLHALPAIQSRIQHTEEVLLDENIEWLAAQKSGFGH